MNGAIARHSPRIVLVVIGIAIPFAACSRQDAVAKDAPNAEAAGSARKVVQKRAAVTSEINAQAANPDPCAFVPIEDARRLLGALSGPPYRGVSADDTSPSNEGHACIYPLVARDKVAEGSVIALELKTSGALGFENGAAVVTGNSKALLNNLGAASADGARHYDKNALGQFETVDGWDYVGGFTDVMTARVGHLAIYAKWTRARGAADSLLRLMDIMRDHIPDRPFLSNETGFVSSRIGGDACSLLTRAEAQNFLGTLVVPPYHSRGLTGLADSHGDACSYYTANHHVLSILPSWSQGKRLFGLLGHLSAMVDSTVGSAVEDSLLRLSGDNWDQSALNVAGDRIFLKGDRLLQVSDRMAAAGYELHQWQAAVAAFYALPRFSAVP
jgi:hypothetical protein